MHEVVQSNRRFFPPPPSSQYTGSVRSYLHLESWRFNKTTPRDYIASSHPIIVSTSCLNISTKICNFSFTLAMIIFVFHGPSHCISLLAWEFSFIFSCKSHKNWTFQHVSIVIVLLLIVKKKIFFVWRRHIGVKKGIKRANDTHGEKCLNFNWITAWVTCSPTSARISRSQKVDMLTFLWLQRAIDFMEKKERLILSSSIAFNNFISIQ